ncbi:MAG: Uma2 family endonuclease [Chloroflexaceae bacterium]|nr:Uma2 family endonuclease [Chloroflexaceae bacterium]NJO06462.1 Uma2 family endonuclease [Chloroflexaceae bacterium]
MGGQEHIKRDRETKLHTYDRWGVQEYWIVDRFQQTIDVYSRDTEGLTLTQTYGAADTLTSPLLPGFAFVVGDVFGEQEGETRRRCTG